MTDKIDPNKRYRTRDGREWKFLDWNEYGNVSGALKTALKWELLSWPPDGKYLHTEGPLDLIEVRPRIQRKVWINVYSDRFGNVHSSREDADRGVSFGFGARVACLELTLDYEEGEGL